MKRSKLALFFSAFFSVSCGKSDLTFGQFVEQREIAVFLENFMKRASVNFREERDATAGGRGNAPHSSLLIQLMKLLDNYLLLLPQFHLRERYFVPPSSCAKCSLREVLRDQKTSLEGALNALLGDVEECRNQQEGKEAVSQCFVPPLEKTNRFLTQLVESSEKTLSLSPSKLPSRIVTGEDPSKESWMEGYDQALGVKVAQFALDNRSSRSLGLCYKYVAEAMEFAGAWPRGFYDDQACHSNDLNCKTWASSFAIHWNPELHQAKIPYRAVFLKNNRNGVTMSDLTVAEEAPVGSILVWEKCQLGTSAAGHIAVVSQKGKEAVSDFKHDVSTVCNLSNLIGIFIPVH